MAPTATDSTSSNPATSRSRQKKSIPATEINKKGYTTSVATVQEDARSSAPRRQTPPTNIWGPGGVIAPIRAPRVRTTDAGGARKKTSRDTPVRADVRRGTLLAAQGPQQSTPRQGQSERSLPKPEEVPLGVAVKMERPMVEEVERQTRGQRENPSWFAWRQNRITASIAHQISRSRFANGQSKTPPASYLASIIGPSRGVKTRAMTWGIERESMVVRKYQRLKSESLGRRIKVQECGLFVDPNCSWLAASPDGIVEDEETGERLLCLEIKCPYKHRQHTVAEACKEDRNFCLELKNEAGKGVPQYRLKTGHSYYTQVQCQMAVVGLHKADFVVFTLKETAIVPVTFDPEFWERTVAKMEKFYRDAVLPALQEKQPVVPLLRSEE
ncbi:uncharacterized protein LOC118783616 [Megalops cyprinoides]|uniref:uncharacterized protein LOC118783616 n=1 Tax=Megalops cyprinoides TaxID=118141 RepID=UPI001864BA20|nr:uncharacterized protein LOC118783616 [Megalops cyprinoides]